MYFAEGVGADVLRLAFDVPQRDVIAVEGEAL